MNCIGKTIFSVVLVFLLALPVLAQRPTSSSSSSDRSNPRGSTSAAGGAMPSVIYSSSSAVPSRPSATPSTYSGRGLDYLSPSSVPSGGGSRYDYRPLRLNYSSFSSYGSLYTWQYFLYHLQMRYYISNSYASRFYRNREPLLTPRLQQLSVWRPLVLSNSMLAAIDELDLMISDAQAGKSVDSQEIRDKIKEIRDFAKRIRNDDLLSYLDQRKNRNVTKGKGYEQLGLDAIAQLRELALDLNTQLRNMFNEPTTSTVSVSNLSQPSFESLSKGIDQLCKIIDKSAKRL